MSKYDDMKSFYENRINGLERDAEYWKNRSIEYRIEAEKSVEECDFYEQILNKLLHTESLATDKVFIFDGRVYKPYSFTLNREDGKADTLNVECRLCFDHKKIES